MAVTVRYANQTAAVYGSVEESLLQVAHDKSYPGHLDPAYIVDGDHSETHSGWTEENGVVSPQHELTILHGASDMADLSCDCMMCDFHRSSQGLNIHEKNELWWHLFGYGPQGVGPRDPIQPRLLPPMAGGSVPSGGFGITSTAVALAAATAKSMIGVTAGANVPPSYIELGASGDATSGNILIEICHGTGVTAGTTTAFTPVQTRGPSQTVLSVCDISYTAEPTVLTVTRRWRYPWPGGPFVLQFPLGRESNAVISSGTIGKFLGIRATSTVAVTNSDWYVEIEE